MKTEKAPHGGKRKNAGRPRTIPHIKGYEYCMCVDCRGKRAEMIKSAREDARARAKGLGANPRP